MFRSGHLYLQLKATIQHHNRIVRQREKGHKLLRGLQLRRIGEVPPICEIVCETDRNTRETELQSFGCLNTTPSPDNENHKRIVYRAFFMDTIQPSPRRFFIIWLHILRYPGPHADRM